MRRRCGPTGTSFIAPRMACGLSNTFRHNTGSWMRRFERYMRWSGDPSVKNAPKGFIAAAPMTAYNAITPVEVDANKRLLALLRDSRGGGRMEQVMWAASGSEAIQKAI